MVLSWADRFLMSEHLDVALTLHKCYAKVQCHGLCGAVVLLQRFSLHYKPNDTLESSIREDWPATCRFWVKSNGSDKARLSFEIRPGRNPIAEVGIAIQRNRIWSCIPISSALLFLLRNICHA